jgi:hypothetical protein
MPFISLYSVKKLDLYTSIYVVTFIGRPFGAIEVSFDARVFDCGANGAVKPGEKEHNNEGVRKGHTKAKVFRLDSWHIRAFGSI